ncbi:MAG: hypothetical protein ACREQM_00265, partial [Candidatus Dormibacteraceae bacterium]
MTPSAGTTRSEARRPGRSGSAGSDDGSRALTERRAVRAGRAAPPTEDRSYLLFVAAALAFALGAGLGLGLLAAFVPALGWRLSEAALVQAHGWTELGGWLGLF